MIRPEGHEPATHRLRASHADRERVVDVLKVAFVQGRLSKDELDTRIGQAFTSKTYADLASVTADLPPSPLGAPRPARKANVEVAVFLTVTMIAIPVALWEAGYLTGSVGLVKLASLLAVFDLLALLAAAAQVLDFRRQARAARRRPGSARPPTHSP